ncbi:SIS domain-containing protein, partial [Planctomycetota bacterium]
MGKAGIIGQKIAGTLSSTGTRAFFLHPGDASHGDLGMIDSSNIILALSNSGESSEIIDIIPSLKTIGAGIIAITGNRDSTLAHEADVVLWIGTIDEACPLGLAPTSSTTAMLAMGDALALTIMNANTDFDQKRYAFYHPGGSLGKRLLRVDEVMRTGDECPILSADSKVKEVLMAITKAHAGAAVLIDEQGFITGFFADGDLRRAVEKSSDVLDRDVKEFMTHNPKTVMSGSFALEALAELKKYMIGDIPIVDSSNKPVGMVSIKDLISLGLLS